ncbi:MAG TPA: pyridoxal phosphate-dependent aminotransferase [Candidatus Nanoarchaeia archaeon]|nr:pyridoxal phosphate-dependent aminotransferase [Candidatus Nanoarchaeia archaeon]
MVSKRLQSIEESATLRMTGLANELKRKGHDVISFSLGEPDFDTPKNICDAAVESLRRGDTHYSPAPGIPELRSAIAEKLQNENNLNVEPGHVIVTPGAKQAVFEAILAVLDEGDEAILFDPAWVTYDPCITIAGGTTVWAPLDPENDFNPTDIAEYITPKTKLIVVNSPSNPTGGIFSRDVLKEIADLAIDHDIMVISDEIYEKIIYEKEHFSIGSLPGMDERTITINGFSKAYAMTGWRLGYLATSNEVFKSMSKLHSHSVSSATTFVQWAGVEALKGPQDFIPEMVTEFKARRDLLVDGLNNIGIKCNYPSGAFYAFADVSEYGNGDEVCEKLLTEAFVAATPGSAFGPHSMDFIRFSYATSRERIQTALERIEQAMV